MRGALAVVALVVALLPSWSGPVNVVGAYALQSGAPTRPQRPDASTFQSGDLVWPRLPNVVVPYDSAPGAAGPDASARWNEQKRAYLSPGFGLSSPLDARRNAFLQTLTYERFVEIYLGAAQTDTPGPAGSNQPYVGHVGIIDMRGGTPWVVEAVPPRVTAVTYDEWLRKRPGEMVWHGRFRDPDPSKRAKIAAEAATQKDKLYNFWNFDLRDESGFYCSKLAWLSIVKATSVPPDDNPDGKRWIWYSPKQLMMSPHIGMLFSPEPYGSKG